MAQGPARSDVTWSTAFPPSSHAVRAGPRSTQPRSRTNRFPPRNSVREAGSDQSVRSIDERPPGLGCSCAGACRFGEGAGVARRTASVSWLVNACRVRWACERRILPRVSVILLRCDWRPGARSTRGCAGCASTVWLTPHVRLACARIAFGWVGMSMVFCGTATCCSPTPGPSPATVRGVFRGAVRAGEGGVFLGAVPGVGTGGANPGLG